MKFSVNRLSKNYFAFVLAALAIYFITFTLLKTLGVLSEFPNANNLLNWDASWYYSIVKEGYIYHEGVQSNTGFFPGFPFLWKSLAASPQVISLINLLLYLSGLYFLHLYFSKTLIHTVFILVLPSTFFLFIPYSEALFYIFSVGFIISWVKNKHLLLILFAISLSIVRPVFFFLIPALISIILFKPWKDNFLKIGLSSFSLLLGAAIGFIIIGYEQNDLFLYSKSQINNWSHSFQLTSFPLTTWRGYRILWLDALALLFTLSATLILILSFYKKWILKKTISIDPIVLVAFGYLFMSLIYVLFFHPVEEDRTSILSLNRYVFVNPFFHLLLFKYMGNFTATRKVLITIISIIIVCLISIGFPYTNVVELSYSQSLFFYIVLAIYMFGVFLIFIKFKYSVILVTVLSLIHLLLLFYLFNSFLKGNWIG